MMYKAVLDCKVLMPKRFYGR